jgi:hypothetical protein
MTEREMIIQLVESQRNRYHNLYEYLLHCPDFGDTPKSVCTAIEDATEYAEELMIEFCKVEDTLPRDYLDPWTQTASPPTDGNTTLEAPMGDWS